MQLFMFWKVITLIRYFWVLLKSGRWAAAKPFCHENAKTNLVDFLRLTKIHTTDIDVLGKIELGFVNYLKDSLSFYLKKRFFNVEIQKLGDG